MVWLGFKLATPGLKSDFALQDLAVLCGWCICCHSVLGSEFWFFVGSLLYSINFLFKKGRLCREKLKNHALWFEGFIIPRQTLFVGVVVNCFTLSVFLSVCLFVSLSMTFWFFLNILKSQWWKFIKFCRHIDIDKLYLYNRKLRARGQFH